MRPYFSLLVIISALLACRSESEAPVTVTVAEPATENVYRYDSTCGECKNAAGEKGYNTFDLAKIRATKNAECLIFPKMSLVYILENSTGANFDEFGGHDIRNYNFKGSVLDSVSCFFNYINEGSFNGTKMSKMDIGYIQIIGEIDEFTELPHPACFVENNHMKCNL